MVGEKVFSCSLIGLKCEIIEIQADISNGLPSFSIVGLGDASVQESKERVRASIKNSGATFPQTKKVVNLAPAQIKKQGSSFDLPIAISILLADNQIPGENLKNSILIGELSLSGKIKPVQGILPITHRAQEKGFSKIFLPKENALEASFIEGIDIYPIEELKDLTQYALGLKEIGKCPLSLIHHADREPKTSLSKIAGLEKAKRGLLITAAGGHNALLYGSPGCGKTLLCRAFESILPEMTKKEILETTKIFSVAGLIDNENPLIKTRPFREVHHTASVISIIGGGSTPKPGEISLANNGVLFFDEIGEFPRQILEGLRQPLEDRYININRANGSIKFPCDFQFLATMNPCPCGYKNDKEIKCICTGAQIQAYQKKLSGPLLDRFDIFIEVEKVKMEQTLDHEIKYENETEEMLSLAKQIQQQRFKNTRIRKNADMELKEIKEHCKLDHSTRELLKKASQNLKMSTRGCLKTIKIARTIADIDGSTNIEIQHIAEAVQYRNRALTTLS